MIYSYFLFLKLIYYLFLSNYKNTRLQFAMSLKNDDDWEAEYEKERKRAINRMINSRCVCCGIKCKDVNDYTMGETYQNKWYCFEHVDLLYKSMNVANTSEFWDKTGRYR